MFWPTCLYQNIFQTVSKKCRFNVDLRFLLKIPKTYFKIQFHDISINKLKYNTNLLPMKIECFYDFVPTVAPSQLGPLNLRKYDVILSY